MMDGLNGMDGMNGMDEWMDGWIEHGIGMWTGIIGFVVKTGKLVNIPVVSRDWRHDPKVFLKHFFRFFFSLHFFILSSSLRIFDLLMQIYPTDR